MSFPLSRKLLTDWAGPQVFLAGLALFKKGQVLSTEYAPPEMRGTVQVTTGTVSCRFRLQPRGRVENLCRCYDARERGLICMHLVAVGLDLIERWNDPERRARLEAEQRRAERLAALDDHAFLPRVPAGTPGAAPAALRLALGRDWEAGCRAGRLALRCAVEVGGRRRDPASVPRGAPLSFSARDESLLFVLEDIAGGPLPAALDLRLPDLVSLLPLLAGRELEVAGGAAAVPVNTVPLASILKLDLDPETGNLVLAVHNELPVSGPAAAAPPFYLVAGNHGWIGGAGQVWPLEKVLPLPFQPLYEHPVVIPRTAVLRFMNQELPALAARLPVATDLRADLFSGDPAEPRFRLDLRGSPASLAATLTVLYGETAVVAGKPDPADPIAVPDPGDFYHFWTRNPAREQQALERLHALGFAGPRGDQFEPVVGEREVLNVLGRGVPALRRAGWRVEIAGTVGAYRDTLDTVMPVVHVRGEPGEGWFEVGFAFEDGKGQSLSEAEIQRALLRGEGFVRRGGRPVLVDAEAVESLRGMFADCDGRDGTRPGTFRLDAVHAAYVKASLEALDGIDLEAPPAWLEAVRCQDPARRVLEPAALPPDLDRILRPYQKDGVAWLRFLEENRFGGILADDMGLGKTLQALAWLDLRRGRPPAAGRKPALVVCPSSLVENWAEESARFTPGLRVLVFSGGERHAKWDDLETADLAVTSYALLRRDIEQWAALEFGAVILDEAQHIKNRSTQNAQAVKRLRADHRLVLTGTPIENSVADLWSIMDFLMPGYLGPYERFRAGYEAPIARGGDEGEAAQARLRRKLRPFLLRRLKQEVARDLPPRIEKLAACSMTRDQQMVYKNLLEASQRKVSDLVARQGFQRARMEILTTLLRLRQACCHLELLRLKDLDSRFPSGKLELFFELLDEAIDGGHRALVFSQFTSMLAILRRELESRGIAYCYLDGATRDRMAVVREFNTNRAIPVFLISLKAGGTGLNLTGADLVIHFDPWWNPAVEAQATDRAHRIGQHRTVYSLKLITRDSVEEKVLALQRRKQQVIQAALADDAHVMQTLTWEDVRGLLSLA